MRCGCGHCGMVFGFDGEAYLGHIYGPRDVHEVDPVPGTDEERNANADAFALVPRLLDRLIDIMERQERKDSIAHLEWLEQQRADGRKKARMRPVGCCATDHC